MLCGNFYLYIFCVFLGIKFKLEKSMNGDSNIFQGKNNQIYRGSSPHQDANSNTLQRKLCI